MLRCVRALTALRPVYIRESYLSTTVKQIKKGHEFYIPHIILHEHFTVGVVGLGLMGHGIAQVAAQAGYDVVALESNHDALDRGDKRIEDSLKKMIAKDVKKGKITEVYVTIDE